MLDVCPSVKVDNKWEDAVLDIFKSVVGIDGYVSSFPPGYSQLFKSAITTTPVVFRVLGTKEYLDSVLESLKSINGCINSIRIVYGADGMDVAGGLGNEWKDEWLGGDSPVCVFEERRLTMTLDAMMYVTSKMPKSSADEWHASILSVITKSYPLKALFDRYHEEAREVGSRYPAAV